MDKAVKASPSPALLERRLLAGAYRYVDGELEKRCTKCGDHWPADSEFFYRAKGEPDGLMCHCRACVEEYKRMKRENLTERKEASEMSTTQQDIVNLLRLRPGLRAVQISDLLDLDPTVVANELQTAERDKLITAEPTTAPNGQSAVAYRVAPTNLGWNAPVAPADAAPSAQPGESAQPSEDSAIPAAGQSEAPRRGSLADAAVAYLEKHGPTDAGTLKSALGIGYAVSTLLRVHLSGGTVERANGLYYLPGQEPAGQISVKAAASPVHDPVHSPGHYAAGGIQVIDILRAKLSPEEFRGYLKGNVIKYLFRAEHKNGAQDYQKAGVYGTWLAELGQAGGVAAKTI